MLESVERRGSFLVRLKTSRATRIFALLLLLAGFPAVVLVGLGARDVGYIEMWEIQSAFNLEGIKWLPVGEGIASNQQMRPFTLLHSAAAAWLPGGPFLWHWLLIALAVAIVGMLVWLALRMVGVSFRRACAAAVAAAWFSGWVGAYMPRSAHMQWAHVFLLAALVVAISVAAGRIRRWYLGLVVVFLVVAFGFHEGIAIQALLLGALILLVKTTRRRRLLISAVWCGAWLAIVFSLYLILQISTNSYQASLAEGGIQWYLVPGLIQDVYALGLRGMFSFLWSPPSALSVLVAMVVVSWAALTFWLWRDSNQISGASRNAHLLIGTTLVVLSPFAAVVYLTNPAHAEDPLRIFGVAGIPLVIGLVLLWQTVPTPALMQGVIGAAIVGIAAVNLVGQKEFTHRLSTFQSAVVEEVARGAGSASSVLLRDDTGAIASTSVSKALPGGSPYGYFYALPPEVLGPAVSFTLGRRVAVRACATERGALRSETLLPRCTEPGYTVPQRGERVVVLKGPTAAPTG